MPVLLLPPVVAGGAPVVMTESAAMILHLADMAGPAGARLAPEPSSPHRPAFLRWLLFLVTEIYPNITIAEHADHLAVPADTIAAFQAAMTARRDDLWRMMAAEAGSPWFLGERFSAIDLYLAVMSGWAGGRARFAATVPRLGRIADAARALPQVAAVLARHGDPDEAPDALDATTAAAPGTTPGETA
ncbi:glutathione S-transferase [Tistrella bauzanensis]